jgi:Cytochrome P450
MTRFPEIQRRAQEEIDHVTGGNRLPTIADRDNMPYVCALLSETYRWRPVVLTGLSRSERDPQMSSSNRHAGFPHRTTEADIHRGYYIPKGSIIVPNIW